MLSANLPPWTNPTTWPWFVYFWLAAIAAGYAKPIWRWLQRNRATSWPITEGRIETADVHERKWFSPSMSFRGHAAKHVAELGYSYSVAGTTYSGTHKHLSITGCVASSADGLTLKNEKDKKVYALSGDFAALGVGERGTLNGKNVKDSNGRASFQVEKLTKDYGRNCPALS